ncbi:hypothetical protein TNIN_254481 [Trichonephila inaurata madagascariensis]|uniref:Uncharacterized protein n=1 Tax=Trichonephila inaurata madagascariensis TaxID=2747483 RepID=A0A8X7CUB2_9ARAC|nr:hypothetical protein TNIN_254481 [Trichonephila inaurata madagascariensis]
MKCMRDSKGPITYSAMNKMMKKFEATDGRPSTAAVVAMTVEQTVQSMSAVEDDDDGIESNAAKIILTKLI